MPRELIRRPRRSKTLTVTVTRDVYEDWVEYLTRHLGAAQVDDKEVSIWWASAIAMTICDYNE